MSRCSAQTELDLSPVDRHQQAKEPKQGYVSFNGPGHNYSRHRRRGQSIILSENFASRRLRLTRTCRGVKYLEEVDMAVSASVIRLVLDKGCMPPTRWGSVGPDELFYTCALAASGLKLVWQLPHKPLSGQSFAYTWLIHHDSFCHPVRPSRNRISHLLLPTSTAAASSKSLSLENRRQLLHGHRVESHR